MIVVPQDLRGGADADEPAVLFFLPLSHVEVCAKIGRKQRVTFVCFTSRR